MTNCGENSPYSDHIQAIGNAVIAFQTLETALRQGLNALFRPEWPESFSEHPIEKLALVALAQASFGGLCQIAGTVPTTFTVESIRHDAQKRMLISQMLNEGKPELERGLKLAHQAEQRRNQLVHSHWFATDFLKAEAGKILRAKVQRSGSVSSHQEDVETLQGAARDAELAMEAVWGGLNLYKLAVLTGWKSLHN